MVRARYGLRTRMAVSYVLVTAAAVVVVEAIMIVALGPLSAEVDPTFRVQSQAVYDAKSLTRVTLDVMAAHPGVSEARLGELVAQQGIDVIAEPSAGVEAGVKSEVEVEAGVKSEVEAEYEKSLRAIAIPRSDNGAYGSKVIVAPDGSVLSSSSPRAYPPGSRLPAQLMLAMSGSGVARLAGREIAWGAYPLQAPDSLDRAERPVGPNGKADVFGLDGKGTRRVIAAVFVLAPAKISGAPKDTPIGPLVAVGAMVLVLIVPVGMLFGLLTTGRLVRRVRRLAEVTTTVAAGDLRPRVPVSGADEIGRLEDGFNRMAERLSVTLDAERGRADADGRRIERARITRELHDSISQDLFSLSLLAGGMRKALPAQSELRAEAQAMERTAARAMREMQALLLELRPVALEDLGLVAALEELCRAYEARLGIRVESAFAELHLEPPIELAVLRVVQEALGNAVRHGGPELIRVALADGDGQVNIEISDDGSGFDLDRAGERHGMGLDLMRERVAELGGAVDVVSAPGEGTTVRVRLPERSS